MAAVEAGIKTFLIADVRGYTRFTQERGDEAAARLATRFAELAREAIEAADGTLVELPRRRGAGRIRFGAAGAARSVGVAGALRH